MLRYTGHPLVDIGAATIAALVGKRDLAAITETDLKQVADFIEREYPKDPLKSFLGVAFTTNAWFNQTAFDRQPEKRADYAARLLRGYREETPRSAESCVFTGEPAVATALSDKLPPGRAFRQHIPMITGEGVINFYPYGDAGLPVSGKALLCIQAFPMGCAKCGGRLLAVHSDNPDLIQDFVSEFSQENRRALLVAQQAGSKKMPEAKYSAKTMFISTLLKLEQSRLDEAREYRPSSVTVYHLTNFGAVNALDPGNLPMEIHYLPLELTDFLSQILGPAYKGEWNAIVDRAWWISQPKKKSRKRKDDTQNESTLPRRNMLYEDLFLLPADAGRFIRRYFLRIPLRLRSEQDPRETYPVREEAGLVSWKLSELFLRKVMAMTKERIDGIRNLGDRLATYIVSQNDRKFFSAFFQNRYDYFRSALLRANLAEVQRGNAPIITLDPYMEVFEEGVDMARPDWKLARDLLLIRMVEQLYQQGWLGSHPEAIPEVSEEPESTLQFT
jgi:CRISPR-associated protein Cst1